MFGEIRITDDVPDAFVSLLTERLSRLTNDGLRSPTQPFRLGCSGGGSGAACYQRLASELDIAWQALCCYFADERCVDPTSKDANQALLRHCLEEHLGELGGFFPMDCTKGAHDYERLLHAHGPFDLLQLGLGPDGHTASLFPASTALDAPPDQLVVRTTDPSGRNPHERLTITYTAIAAASLVVVTVLGADKAAVLAKIAAGEDFPAGRITAKEVIWLCDHAAAAQLPSNLKR